MTNNKSHISGKELSSKEQIPFRLIRRSIVELIHSDYPDFDEQCFISKAELNDYLINLKSELEIRTLHEKIDHLIIHQQQELMEMQRVQIEMLSDIQNQINK
ncbi:MAG: hypothetical protein ACI9AU_000327 [Bacteroidia bacterium]|jgi:hypothetical protein